MKYANVLVIMDGASRRQPGGILGAAKQLHSDHGLWVFSPEQAVEFVQSRLDMLQEE